MGRRVIPYADISTLHLRRDDLPLILRDDAPYFLAKCPEGYTSFFYIPEDDMWEEAKKEWEAFGLSPAFANCMFAARWEGCPYVRFDSDGALWELPVYEDDGHG